VVNSTDGHCRPQRQPTTRLRPATISNPHDFTRDEKSDGRMPIYARKPSQPTNSTAPALITSTPGVYEYARWRRMLANQLRLTAESLHRLPIRSDAAIRRKIAPTSAATTDVL